ncbi:MAG: STAS domain-containing protein [Candidatus Eisenbacteria bacterium]
MKIKERKNGDVVVLEISGRIEGGPDAEIFRGKIGDLIVREAKKVIFELSEVPWMNSTGVGIIISGFTSIRKSGGEVKLLNVKERVKSIFMITRLLTVLESYYEEEEAVKSFK